MPPNQHVQVIKELRKGIPEDKEGIDGYANPKRQAFDPAKNARHQCI
jgi:hypothetical protein